MNNVNKIEYYDVTHVGRCSDYECQGEQVVGSYGRYSTYEKAKARFDEVVKKTKNEYSNEEIVVKANKCVVGDEDDGWTIEIEKIEIELDSPIDEFI